jgi:hypothetical protein
MSLASPVGSGLAAHRIGSDVARARRSERARPHSRRHPLDTFP